MRPTTNIIGQRFGKLAVLAEAGFDTRRNRLYSCRCDCGKTHVVRGSKLRAGETTSCGCSGGGGRKRHGEATVDRWGTREYRIWRGMIARCRNPKARSYKDYGGRGIIVCDRWSKGEKGMSGYECFLADVGRRPSPQHSIDREDTDGHYEPGNVRWQVDAVQRATKRNTITVTINGERMSLRAACLSLGLSYTAIKKRVDRGKSPMVALGLEK